MAETRIDLRAGQREGDKDEETEHTDTNREDTPTQNHHTQIFHVLERDGDLLQIPENIPIAHCISADYALGAGIAKQIRSKYGVQQLNTHVSTPGQCVTTKHGEKVIFHLVTKWWYRDLPTYENLNKCLVELKNQCQTGRIEILALPKLGCGLDLLDFPKVKGLIEKVFADGDTQVIVFSLPK